MFSHDFQSLGLAGDRPGFLRRQHLYQVMSRDLHSHHDPHKANLFHLLVMFPLQKFSYFVILSVGQLLWEEKQFINLNLKQLSTLAQLNLTDRVIDVTKPNLQMRKLRRREAKELV